MFIAIDTMVILMTVIGDCVLVSFCYDLCDMCKWAEYVCVTGVESILAFESEVDYWMCAVGSGHSVPK
jgi:hypothetical protein